METTEYGGIILVTFKATNIFRLLLDRISGNPSDRKKYWLSTDISHVPQGNVIDLSESDAYVNIDSLLKNIK